MPKTATLHEQALGANYFRFWDVGSATTAGNNRTPQQDWSEGCLSKVFACPSHEPLSITAIACQWVILLILVSWLCKSNNSRSYRSDSGEKTKMRVENEKCHNMVGRGLAFHCSETCKQSLRKDRPTPLSYTVLELADSRPEVRPVRSDRQQATFNSTLLRKVFGQIDAGNYNAGTALLRLLNLEFEKIKAIVLLGRQTSMNAAATQSELKRRNIDSLLAAMHNMNWWEIRKPVTYLLPFYYMQFFLCQASPPIHRWGYNIIRNLKVLGVKYIEKKLFPWGKWLLSFIN